MPAKIAIDRERVADFCKRHGIRRLSLFGSVLTDRFGPDSDVDVLVEFERGRRAGYFTMGRLIVELSELFGRHVDVRTPMEISPHFRQRVLDDAEVQYAAA